MAEPFDSGRLDDLEVRLTFIDDAVGALAGADAEISRRLMKLEQAVLDMRQELANLRVATGHDAASEPPPPHY